MFKTFRNSARKSAMLLAGAAAVLATPALAQVRDLDNEASDVRVFQGRVAGEPAVFYVTTPAEGSLQIDVLAQGELDPIVRVRDAESGETIAEDDDGGEGLNSRVTISDASRRIVIEVDSFGADWAEDGEDYGGSFDLRLAISNCTAGGGTAITYGASENGSICGAENLYTFAGEAGQTVEIAMIAESDDLDPYLELRDADGETVAFNDDGGDSLNSLLRHTFEESGTYTVVATSYGGTTGDYRLRVRSQRVASAQLPLQVIGLDDEASGELVSSWSGGEDGLGLTHIDYQLSDAARAALARGNGEVTIRMTSAGGADADFGGSIDPYVEIGFDTPLGFAVIDADDDGAGDLNSLLPIDLGPIAGNSALLDMLRIRAQGFGGSGGAYTLTITEGMEQRVTDGWGIE